MHSLGVLGRVGYGWAWTLLRRAAKGNISAAWVEEVTAASGTLSHEPWLHVPAKLSAWLQQQKGASLSEDDDARGSKLLWFVLWSCNKDLTAKYLGVGFAFIFLR